MNDERIPSETERYTLFLAHKAKSLGITAEELMDRMSEGSYDRKEENALQREFMDWEEQNYPGLYVRRDDNINSYESKINDPEWDKIKEEETAKAKGGR
ncbi:MAG: hypothetical protein MR297_01600 [Tenericutes bacterium]|nr:hypothetical protein [Mycoplasmatota bacterium]